VVLEPHDVRDVVVQRLQILIAEHTR
jgi:hypothetical protein